MPAGAGRTTMCPTELGYDADMPPCLRLLPIETRLQPQALMEWRMVPEKWQQISLDVDDSAHLAQALQQVSEVRHVTQDEARALGFWHGSNPEDNPPTGPDGLIEVPRWRHALINIAHPLLKQGLVILDTPGLNAIGAEPELMASLIPQAHAVVFILAADTGVTKSDLSIWREHWVTGSDSGDNRLVVLNKIDTLWDALSHWVDDCAQAARHQVACKKNIWRNFFAAARKFAKSARTHGHHPVPAGHVVSADQCGLWLFAASPQGARDEPVSAGLGADRTQPFAVFRLG